MQTEARTRQLTEVRVSSTVGPKLFLRVVQDACNPGRPADLILNHMDHLTFAQCRRNGAARYRLTDGHEISFFLLVRFYVLRNKKSSLQSTVDDMAESKVMTEDSVLPTFAALDGAYTDV